MPFQRRRQPRTFQEVGKRGQPDLLEGHERSRLDTLWAQRAALLDDQTVSSAVAAVDLVTGIDASYALYLIELIGVRPSTNGASLWLRTSTDGGSTFNAGAAHYSYTTGAGSTGAAQILCQSVATGNAAEDGGVSGHVHLAEPSNAASMTKLWGDIVSGGITAALTEDRFAGQRNAADDVDAIRFMFSAGNIAAGRFRLFGIG